MNRNRMRRIAYLNLAHDWRTMALSRLRWINSGRSRNLQGDYESYQRMAYKAEEMLAKADIERCKS